MSRPSSSTRRPGPSRVDSDDSNPDMTDSSSDRDDDHDDHDDDRRDLAHLRAESSSSASAERAARDAREQSARERRARQAREEAEEEERRRRRKEKMQQYQQEAAGTATAATSNARPSSARQTSSSGMQLNLTKQVPADQGISSLVDSAAVAASPFVLLPSTLHPLSVTPALSYFGSTTSASSSASTPLPLHPSLGRPVVYASQELTINDAVGLEAITVRNYYVEAITVKQMVAIPVRGDREGRSKQVWRTILNRHPLMQRPHEEGEAQRMVTLHTSLFHAEKYQPENLYRLRFDLECSSPAWKTFYLQDVQCWRKRTEGAAEGETTARGRSARPASAKALRPAGTGAAAKSNAPSSAEDLLAQFSSAPYAASSSLLATKLASPSVRQRIDEIASSLQIIGE